MKHLTVFIFFLTNCVTTNKIKPKSYSINPILTGPVSQVVIPIANIPMELESGFSNLSLTVIKYLK